MVKKYVWNESNLKLYGFTDIQGSWRQLLFHLTPKLFDQRSLDQSAWSGRGLRQTKKQWAAEESGKERDRTYSSFHLNQPYALYR